MAVIDNMLPPARYRNLWEQPFRQSEVVRGMAIFERERMLLPLEPMRYPGDDEMGGPRMLKQYTGPEATIGRLVRRDMGYADAQNAIERANGRYLNGGQATAAYAARVFVKEKDKYEHLASSDHPEYASHYATERCYRVSSKDRPARRVIDLALEHQDDPYAPKVYAVFDLSYGNWVSEMELLERAHTPGYRVDPDKMLYGWQLGEDWQYTGRPGKVKPSPMLMDKSPFMRAVERLRVRIGADYDLHGANVMKRGEQLVVLDPLYQFED